MDALMLSQPETVAFGIAMGEKKAKAGWVRQIVLAFWAGAFIAFAAEGSNMAAFNLLARPETYGLGKCLAGTIFPVGLMLVMLTGAELFTGNTLMCMALAEKRITLAAMLRNWLFVYIGNFLGSLFLAHMIVTSGTICMDADMLMARGAKSVRAAITHPVLSGPAYERINDSALQEVIVTDTIPLNPNKDLHKFTVLSVADIFADVIERVHNYKEISSIFFK